MLGGHAGASTPSRTTHPNASARQAAAMQVLRGVVQGSSLTESDPDRITGGKAMAKALNGILDGFHVQGLAGGRSRNQVCSMTLFRKLWDLQKYKSALALEAACPGRIGVA